MQKRVLILNAGSFLAGAIFALPALGAEVVDGAAAERAVAVTDEIIVVTARKRAEDVQKVSEAITVATGAQLERLQIVSPQDLTRVAPGLTFRASTTPTSSAFAVRGIGTSTFSPGVEQSVSTVVDGVVLGQPQTAGAFIDIDHVEVLEGPQGMLFGKNASAGLINIVTRVPELGALAANGNITAGTHGDFRVDGTVNVPVGETLAFRLVGYRNAANGILENRFKPQDDKLNNIENYGFRGKMMWAPSTALRILVQGDYAQDTADCCFGTARIQGLSTAIAAANLKYGIVPGPNNTSVAFDQPNGVYPGAPLRRYWGTSGQIDYDIGDYSLTSITAYRENHYKLDFDGDQTPGNAFNYDGGEYRYHQFSQELRIASPSTDRLSYLAGLYYFTSRNETNFLAGGFLIPGLPLIVGVTQSEVTSRSYAAFGNLEFKVTPAFRLRAGARFTHDDLKAHILSFDAPGALPGSSVILGGTVADFRQSGKASNLSGKLTAEYDIAPEIMVYANIARGYKGPGLSALAGTKPTVDQFVRPEIARTADIGVKSEFFERRLTLNVAAFLENFKDFQAQVYDTSVIPPSFRVTNAGKLITKGVEIQALARPVDRLSLFVNAAYIDGHYKDLKNISCAYADTVPVPHGQCALVAGALVADASGNRLADSPRFSFTVGGDYTLPLTAALSLTFRTDLQWRSNVQFAPNGDDNTIQPSYGIWNASVELAAVEGVWAVQGFVRNIGDKHYADLIAPNAADTNGGYSQYFSRGRERQAGVALRVRLR